MTHGALRVAVLTRAVFPLHGYGGLERHVYDLVRHLDRRGVSVILITRPPTHDDAAGVDPSERAIAGGLVLPAQVEIVPYVTFPFAGRRGTTVIDRSTAYPLFGERVGRRAADLVARGDVDLVHGLGASSLGYARRRLRRAGRPTAPFVFNPQDVEEFGATDPRQARLKRLGYWPLRRAVRLCARAADRVIATDRALEPAVLQHLDVPRARVSTIPNAIDLERCDGLAAAAGAIDVRRQHGIAPEEFVLLSAGRVEENKGLHVLAAALARLGRPAGTPGLPGGAGDRRPSSA